MNKILIIILFQLISFVSFSQNKNLYNNKKHIEVIEILDNFIDTNKTTSHIFYARAESLYKIGNTKAAISDLSKAIKLDSNYDMYFALRAEIYFSNKKYQKALEDFSQAYLLNKLEKQHLLNKSISEYYIKKYDAALIGFNLYLESKPNNEIANYYCGLINLEKEKFTQTLEYANKILDKNQAKYEYFLLRAKAYFYTGKFESANKNFGMALDLNPKNGEIYFYRAISRFEQGNKKGACLDWNKAYKFKYTDANKYLRKYCW